MLSIALGILRLHPRGGLENLCLQIAECLESRGHAVTLLTGHAPSDLPAKVKRLDGVMRPRTNHGRMRAFAAAFAEASRAGYDRTVAFQSMPAQLLVLADRLFDRPDEPLWKRLTPRFRTLAGLEAACMSRDSTTRIIGLAHRQMAEFSDRYRLSADRVAVLPPTLSHDVRRPGRVSREERRALLSDLGIAATGPLWLWIGLQPATKGLDRVLRALVDVRQARLLVCGPEPGSSKLRPIRRLARRLGVGDRITYLGYLPVSEQRFFDALRVADVLAHPARNETTGTVILEAIVNGLPVATMSLCGYSEHVLRSGCGAVLDEPFDAKQFSDALVATGSQRDALGGKGLAYGADPALYEGIARAAELIEAPLDRPWPPDLRARRPTTPSPALPIPATT
jgi:UDP-glucose:(heptosyl)LPS alpha-1,3-glucosyltransferase